MPLGPGLGWGWRVAGGAAWVDFCSMEEGLRVLGCGCWPSMGLVCTESLFVLKPHSGQVSWWSLGAGPCYIHTL